MIEPLRASSVLGATTKLTDASPVPAAEEATVIQVTLGDAVQAQPLGVAMLNVLGPPPAPVLNVEGETAYRQGARCDTRACSPLTTITPSRDEAPS